MCNQYIISCQIFQPINIFKLKTNQSRSKTPPIFSFKNSQKGTSVSIVDNYPTGYYLIPETGALKNLPTNSIQSELADKLDAIGHSEHK